MIRWRGSRRLVLVIVAIALLLDNMLLTVVGELSLHIFMLRKKRGKILRMQQVDFMSHTQIGFKGKENSTDG